MTHSVNFVSLSEFLASGYICRIREGEGVYILHIILFVKRGDNSLTDEWEVDNIYSPFDEMTVSPVACEGVIPLRTYTIDEFIGTLTCEKGESIRGSVCIATPLGAKEYADAIYRSSNYFYDWCGILTTLRDNGLVTLSPSECVTKYIPYSFTLSGDDENEYEADFLGNSLSTELSNQVYNLYLTL